MKGNYFCRIPREQLDSLMSESIFNTLNSFNNLQKYLDYYVKSDDFITIENASLK